MPIYFSKHAEDRRKRRKIAKRAIIETIRNPEETIQSLRGRKLRQRRFGDRILEVVMKTEGARITVITEYFLREEKYAS